MPYAVPEVGVNAEARFTPNGGSEIIMKNSDWSITLTTRNKEAPNTYDGMLRARGLFDCSGTIKGFVDTTQPIESNVAEGSVGFVKLYRSPGKFFAFNCIIDSLKIDTGVDQVETWEMAFSLQSGPVTRPV